MGSAPASGPYLKSMAVYSPFSTDSPFSMSEKLKTGNWKHPGPLVQEPRS
jgi:hypothetical protein